MVLTNLSNGCLADIIGGGDVDKPVLQVLGTKRIPGAEGNARYRLLVSDGKYLVSYAMLATQLNSFAEDNQLTDNTIIRIEKHIVSVVSQEKKVVVILDLTILHPGGEVKVKLGDPQQLTDTNIKKKGATTTTPASVNGSSHGTSNGSTSNNRPSVAQSSTALDHTLVSPIASLSPYQNKWAIKVRVTSKSAIRSWSNAKGQGRLFSVDLMDESGEIRATAFTDVVDKFYELLQVDKIYFISKCSLKPANKQFTKIKNDYEMNFNNDTVVQECLDADETIPNVTYNLVPLSQISQMAANSIVDVGGVCRDAGDVLQFTAKTTGRELKKRDVTLVDNSLASVTLTLWGEDAENFDAALQPVIFIKSGRINEFGGGKSISLGAGSTMKINPDINEAHRLRGWYDNEGQSKDFANVSARTGGTMGGSSEWVNFYEAKARNLGSSDTPDYFQCKAIIHLVKTNSCVYKSCAKPDCNKKVMDNDNGVYTCEKCQVDSPDFKYRILFNMSIGDWTTNRWVTVFADIGEKLLDMSSDDVGRAFDNNKDELEKIFSKILFKSYIFKLRTKVEHFGDSQRNKIQVMNITPINYKEYNSLLVKSLQALTGIGKNYK